MEGERDGGMREREMEERDGGVEGERDGGVEVCRVDECNSFDSCKPLALAPLWHLPPLMS